MSETLTAAEFHDRVQSLHRRGLGDELARALWESGSTRILRDLEGLTNPELERLERLSR